MIHAGGEQSGAKDDPPASVAYAWMRESFKATEMTGVRRSTQRFRGE